MWGTDGVRVTHGGRRLGAGYSPERACAECVGWHVCKRGDRFAALQPISTGACEAVASTAPPVRRGGWRCGWITAPSICRPLHQPDQVLGRSSRPCAFVEQPQTNGSRRQVQSHAQADHPWPHLPQHRRAAERRPRVRPNSTMPQWIVEKNGYLSRSSSSGVAHRDVTQARRMRQTCVQGTGLCDTVIMVLDLAVLARWDDGRGSAFCQPVAQGFAVIALVGDEFGGGRHGFDTALGDLAIMDVSWCQEQDEGPAFRIADSVKLGVAAPLGAADAMGQGPPFPPPAQR